MRRRSLTYILSAGTALLLFGDLPAQVAPPAAYSNPLNISYIRTWEAKAPEQDPNHLVIRPVTDVDKATSYYDGLGRPLQTVTWQGSPLLKDVVTPVVYDALGRETYKYLPFASLAVQGGDVVNDGNFKLDPFQQQAIFSQAQFPGETYYYSQTNYEASVLDRVLSSYSAGNSWVGSGRGVSSQYLVNSNADSVQIWTIGTVAGSIPVNTGTYPAGQLFRSITTDEQGNQIIVYKDNDGHVVLKKIQQSTSPSTGHAGWLCTYYVYDDLENLRYVLQPRAVETINGSWVISQQVADEFCYRYEYDALDRMYIKKVPGAGEVWTVYDARNRPVMSQDSVLRIQGKWLVSEYDDQNRPWRKGLLTDANNRAYHQNLASNSTSYPNTSSGYEVVTQTYYDDYSWVAAAAPALGSSMATNYTGNTNYFITAINSLPDYAVAPTASPITRGMATGSAVKVLGTSNQYLFGVSFYDDHGRLIQTQTTNYTGAVDTVTTQYDFTGLKLRSLLQTRKAGANSQSHTVLEKTAYDPAGRIVSVTQTVNSIIGGIAYSTPEETVASNSYNELGQLQNKTLGNSLESLAYDYSIRGWLLGVNRNYLLDQGNHYFGFELGYDKSSTIISGTNYFQPQYNGNISGTVWKSAGDGVKRKFDYGYDPANRVLSADFNQYTGTIFDKSAGLDFSVSGLSYDVNGNILSMQQKGWMLGGSKLIDDLQYSYMNGGISNKLLAVTEDATIDTTNFHLGDFTDKNRSQDDYVYDGNGNLSQDKNKNIRSISYNYLNLPQQIGFNKDGGGSKGNIVYTYDAAGIKLAKTVTDSTTTPVKQTVTLYMDGFVYQNDTLQLLGQGEGRLRYAKKYFLHGDSAYQYFYDYFLKDNMGNTRVVLTEEKDTARYMATMEAVYRAKETQLFSNVQESSYASSQVPGGYPTDTTTRPNDSVARVNGSMQKLGPGIVLKVMSGDMVDVAVRSFYRGQGSGGGTNSALTDILGSLAQGLVTLTAGSGGHGTFADLNTLSSANPVYNALNSFRTTNNPDVSGKPRAYLNWVLLDDQFNYVSTYPQSGAVQVKDTGQLNTLGFTGINITKSGYLYIYVDNETQNWDVFFDNLSVTTYSGPLLEESHYYPFGLTMAGISDKVLKTPYAENKYRYNGKEEQNKEFSDGSGLDWDDYGARMYDPQLGRWHVMDAMQDKIPSITAYNYCLNNPLRLVDPTGMWFDDPMGVTTTDPGEIARFLALIKAAVGKGIAAAISNSAELAHSVYEDLASTVGNNPYDMFAANVLVSMLRTAVAPHVERNPNDQGWFDLYLIWQFEWGDKAQLDFGPDARTTKDLMHQEGVNITRNMANKQAASRGKGKVSHLWTYGQPAFYESLKTGDGATIFLGSYLTEVDIAYNNNGTATYTFTVTNQTSWESGTRFRKAAKPGGEHQGIIPNRDRGSPGIQLGGTINETWTWRETVVLPKQEGAPSSPAKQ